MIIPFRTPVVICLLLGCSVLASSAAFGASDTDRVTLSPNIDPMSARILRRMSDFLRQKQKFKVSGRVTFDAVQETGQKIQFNEIRAVSLNRPNKLFGTIKRDDGTERRIWSNGGRLTIYEVKDEIFSTIAVPKKIDEMLDHVSTRYGINMPLSDFLYETPYEKLITGVKSGFYVGLHRVEGVSTHHLAFRQELVDWQIWIAAEGPPVPRKIVIDYKDAKNQPQFTTHFDKWNFTSAHADADYSFEPGKNDVKVRTLLVK